MLWEPIFIIILAAADIIFTYLQMHKLSTMGKRYLDAEGNPVVRYFVTKLGLHRGMRVAALYSVSAITLVIYYLSWRYTEMGFRNMLYFVMGVYSMMLLMHISSFRFLSGRSDEDVQIRNTETISANRPGQGNNQELG